MTLHSIASNDHSADERLPIVQAGTAACRHYGPSKTTVADIARLLGKSPASLYRIFPSKAEIWDAIAADFYESHLCFEPSSAGDLARATDQLKETMLGLHRLLLQAQQGDPQMYRLIVLAASSNWPSYRQYRNRLHGLVGELIRAGVGAKEFQRTDTRCRVLLMHLARRLMGPQICQCNPSEPLRDFSSGTRFLRD